MTRLITLILFLLAYLAVGWLFYAQSVQLQRQELALGWLFVIQNIQIPKRDEQYKDLRSYIESHNKRLNRLEQPELLRAHRKAKKCSILKSLQSFFYPHYADRHLNKLTSEK